MVFFLNRGTPKSSILMGFSSIKHPFGGTPMTMETTILSFRPAIMEDDRRRSPLVIEHSHGKWHICPTGRSVNHVLYIIYIIPNGEALSSRREKWMCLKMQDASFWHREHPKYYHRFPYGSTCFIKDSYMIHILIISKYAITMVHWTMVHWIMVHWIGSRGTNLYRKPVGVPKVFPIKPRVFCTFLWWIWWILRWMGQRNPAPVGRWSIPL